jgi:pSer/pThr/pTyr-binding forkhead associated (FHA) protein
MVIGRHSEADIRLPLPDVSRRHCRFNFRDGAWHVRDLNSLNGTFVNGEQREESLLCHGDTVRIGGFTFLAQLDAQKANAREDILSISRSLPSLAPDEEPTRKASCV